MVGSSKRPPPVDVAGPSQRKKVKAVGIEKGGPGLDYQVQLLMFYARQGYELSQQRQPFLFELGKEREEAGKFDDIIVRYKQEQNQAWNYLLIQCKYKQDKQDKITTGQLLSDDSTAPFTLLKYFSSYIGSTKKYRLGNTEEKIESCIMATNTDFEYGGKNRLKLKPAKARVGEAGTGSRGTNLSLEPLDERAVNEILTIPQANGVKYYKLTNTPYLVEELEEEFKKSHNVIINKLKKKRY